MKVKWRTSAACERSPRHDVSQDSTCIKGNSNKPELVCLALSDGAGSALKSEYGSKALVEEISNTVWLKFDELFALIQKQGEDIFISNIIDEANKILERVSIQEGCKLKDLSSTLMFVAADGKKALWFHVGDGVIIQKASGSFSVLSLPFNGEYANETIFVNSLTAKNAAHAGIIDLSEDHSFFLMSDGPETVFYSKTKKDINSKELLSFIDEKNKTIEDDNYRNELLRYILHERCRPYSSDDLSIIAAGLIKTLQEKRKKRRIRRRRKCKGRCHHYNRNRKKR